MREAALVRLLDDPSPVVQAALLQELRRLGGLGSARGVARADHLHFLKVIAQDRTHRLTGIARRLLDEIVGPEPEEQLRDFIRRQSYDLETGMFLVNRVIHPGIEMDAVREPLDGLAARCRELIEPDMSSAEKCKRINRVMFHEAAFRGNRADFENPLNSCIEAVLRQREGLPITLSVIYLLVAQRLSLQLEPVGFPGQFLVGCFSQTVPFFIDPYERGRFRSTEELREWLVRMQVPPEVHYFAPVPVAEVLCRVCRNLALHFERRHSQAWANRFRGFVREFEAQYDLG